MVSIDLICIGSIKEKYLKEAINEFSKRLTSFCKLNIIELKESRITDENNCTLIDKALKNEEEKMLKQLDEKSYIITMCIEGEDISSVDFSKKISSIIGNGKSKITFIIGSSFGISENIKNKSNLKMSFSKMTFTHQFFRVMLLEQVYRAFCINNNIKYHK